MEEGRVPVWRPAPESPRSPLLQAAAWLGIALTALAAAWMVLAFSREFAPSPPPVIPTPPVFDAEVIAAAVEAGVAVALDERGTPAPQGPLTVIMVTEVPVIPPTPTPDPSLPTTTPRPSPTPEVICPLSESGMDALPVGTVCKWPRIVPTPTPLPSCATPVSGAQCQRMRRDAASPAFLTEFGFHRDGDWRRIGVQAYSRFWHRVDAAEVW